VSVPVSGEASAASAINDSVLEDRRVAHVSRRLACGESALIHLQFRRFVDCPICNTHIAQLKKRAGEIKAAGIKEVICFHSSAKSIRSYQKEIVFIFNFFDELRRLAPATKR
jgi:hypothetical protein